MLTSGEKVGGDYLVMPVLIECISVVTRCDTLDRKFPGGLRGYEASIPNGTYCSDNEITRVGFTAPSDVGRHIDKLKECGIIFSNNNRFIEIAVVDMLSGFTAECDWLEFKTTHFLDTDIFCSWCRLAGSNLSNIFFPSDWEFETSMTKNSNFVTNDEFSKTHVFIKHEDSQDVWMHKESGKLCYITRPE